MDNNGREKEEKKQRKSAIDQVNNVVSSFNKIRNLQIGNVPLFSGSVIRNPTPISPQQIRWFVNPYFITFGTVIVIYIIFFSGLFGGGSSPFGLGNSGNSPTQTPQVKPPSTPGVCPSTAGNHDPTSCRYLNPSIDLFASDIPQGDLDTYINRYSSVFVDGGQGSREDFVERVNYIVSAAKEAGLNPVLFLGYWKSESLFGTASSRELGCAGDGFYEEVDCAMGIREFSDPVKNPIANCARSKDENSIACKTLQETRKNSGYDALYPITYPIATFDDFAEAHGSFAHDPDGRRGNCTSTYNVLLEVAAELNACTNSAASPSPGPQVASSCPIPNGVLTCGTINTPVVNGPLGTCGHCGVGYNAPCDFEGTKWAIDIDTPDNSATDVVMPLINGDVIDWTLEHVEPKGGEETLYGYAGTDTKTQEKYYLQYSHVGSRTSSLGQTYKSGEVGAKTCVSGPSGCNHLHVQLGTGASSLGSTTWTDAMHYLCQPPV